MDRRLRNHLKHSKQFTFSKVKKKRQIIVFYFPFLTKKISSYSYIIIHAQNIQEIE